MKKNVLIFVSGLLFALGLGLSGMTDANKVVAFLNITGEWDPSLAFVMVGAIGINALLFRQITNRKQPLFAELFQIPTRTEIDFRLIGGSALFGIGWALGGICPGPGIVSMVTFSSGNLMFVLSLIVGMLTFQFVDGMLKKGA